MQDGNVSLSDQLDTVRKRGNENIADAEHGSEDQINTKRESSLNAILPKFFKFGKNKINPLDESAVSEQPQQSALIQGNKIVPFSPPKMQISRVDPAKITKATLVEKNPGFRRRRNSSFTGFARTLTQENILSSNFEKQQRGRRASVRERAVKRFKEFTMVRVAASDLVDEDDDTLGNIEGIRIKFPRFMINPYGKFSKIWKFTTLFVLLVMLVVYPVRLCFELNNDSDFRWGKSWYPFDFIIDLFCIADIAVGFLTAYENESKQVVTSRRSIIANYAKNYLLTDLFGLFPVNPLIIQLSGVQYGTVGFNNTNYITWRCIRLLKIFKTRKIFKKLENCLLLLKRDLEFVNLARSSLLIFIIVHLSACLWNLLGEIELLDSWLDVERNRYDSLLNKYAQSIYFSLTVLLTAGYGNISGNNTQERSVLVIWMFFGVIVYAYIIGSLANILGKLTQTTTSKNERELFYNNYAKTFDIPYQLLDQVLMTIGTQYSSNTAWIQVAETNKILAELPKSLYADICTHVYRDLIEKIDFFQDKPKHFLVRILPALKPTNFNYGDEVYSHGDPSTEVFFVHKGRVTSTCHDRTGKLRSHIFVEGSYFGERDIIYKRARASTAFAETKVTLWKLNRREFLAIMDEFPDIKREVFTLAKIKEMYRAPIVRTTESKVKAIIYAKKILTKGRTKRFDDTAGDAVSPLLPSKSGEINPLLLAPQESLLSPLLKKNSQPKVDNLLGSTLKVLAIKDVAQSPKNNPTPTPTANKEPSPVKSFAKRQMAKQVGRQRSLFHEDYIHLLGPRSEDSIAKDEVSFMRKDTPETPKSETKIETPKSILKPETPKAGAAGTFSTFSTKAKGFASPESKFHSHTVRKLSFPEPQLSVEERVRMKLMTYLQEKGYEIKDFDTVEKVIKGPEVILEAKTQSEEVYQKAAEEIEQYADAESRVTCSVENYQEVLTILINQAKSEETAINI